MSKAKTEAKTNTGPQTQEDLIGVSKDDLLKQFGKPLAKDRFTLATVQADAEDENKEANPLRLALLDLMGEGQTIPDTYTEITEFHWKTDELYTSVWMLKHKTIWQSFKAITWHQDHEWDNGQEIGKE